MKKLILSTLSLCLVVVVVGTNSLAASPLPATFVVGLKSLAASSRPTKNPHLKTENFKKLLSKEKDLKVIKSKSEKAYRCFDITIYTSCGTAWAGDYCIYTDLKYLTSGQFGVAWAFKDYQHCGGPQQ